MRVSADELLISLEKILRKKFKVYYCCEDDLKKRSQHEISAFSCWRIIYKSLILAYLNHRAHDTGLG